MCIGAETEVRRYVPPRTGTLTLVIADGFTTKVSTVSVYVYIRYIYVYCIYCMYAAYVCIVCVCTVYYVCILLVSPYSYLY